MASKLNNYKKTDRVLFAKHARFFRQRKRPGIHRTKSETITHLCRQSATCSGVWQSYKPEFRTSHSLTFGQNAYNMFSNDASALSALLLIQTKVGTIP